VLREPRRKSPREMRAAAAHFETHS